MLSVLLHPVRVNMNSPPSACLLCHLSVFSDFSLSLLTLHLLLLSLLLSYLLYLSPPFFSTSRQTGPIRGLDFDHMPVEDRPKPAALLMQGKP